MKLKMSEIIMWSIALTIVGAYVLGLALHVPILIKDGSLGIPVAFIGFVVPAVITMFIRTG